MVSPALVKIRPPVSSVLFESRRTGLALPPPRALAGDSVSRACGDGNGRADSSDTSAGGCRGGGGDPPPARQSMAGISFAQSGDMESSTGRAGRLDVFAGSTVVTRRAVSSLSLVRSASARPLSPPT